nr:type IV pilus modification protein PilV [Gammaproteobacteria bacterium]
MRGVFCTDYKMTPGGFTLIEVLVAMLVLSIGLLGLAGLHAAGMRNNHSAYLRSQASLLAYDLADRMRANLPSVATGSYDNPASPAVDANCKGTGCSVTAMASHDVAEWRADLAVRLPAGEGVVCIDSTPADGADAAAPECDAAGTQYTIKIWWDERRDGSPLQQFVTSFQP